MEPQSIPPRPPIRGVPAQWEALRDRASDPRFRAGALILAAAIAGFFWYQVGQDQSAGALAPAPTRTGSVLSAKTTTTTKPPLFIHVAGAVARPGVVQLAAGARVADAISAAGGGLPDADLDRLNLAAKVTDGQRIPVSRVGAPGIGGLGVGDGMAEGTNDGTNGGGSSGGGAASETSPLDLNTATSTQLETLPGIGPSFAAAIIRERERRGGYTSIDQLRDVRGIGEKRFADLKPLVTV